jgi:hypothetical protein
MLYIDITVDLIELHALVLVHNLYGIKQGGKGMRWGNKHVNSIVQGLKK